MSKKKETFLDYAKEAKNDFVNDVNRQEWNTQLRTSAESFVIAYDQLLEQYKTAISTIAKIKNQLSIFENIHQQ